jgi:hypothetical protein
LLKSRWGQTDVEPLDQRADFFQLSHIGCHIPKRVGWAPSTWRAQALLHAPVCDGAMGAAQKCSRDGGAHSLPRRS